MTFRNIFYFEGPNGIEFQFSILGCATGDDTLAVLAYPKGKSICEQEKNLRKEYPNASNEEIAKHIAMIYDTVALSRDQKLTTMLWKLKKYRSPFLTNMSEIVRPSYQIYSLNGSGHVYLFLSKAAVEEDEQGKQLLQWIDEMFALLKRACEEKS